MIFSRKNKFIVVEENVIGEEFVIAGRSTREEAQNIANTRSKNHPFTRYAVYQRVDLVKGDVLVNAIEREPDYDAIKAEREL